jgi:hypothetical protein
VHLPDKEQCQPSRLAAVTEPGRAAGADDLHPFEVRSLLCRLCGTGLEVDDGCSAEVAEKRRIEHAANGVVAVLFAEQTRQHPVGVDGEHVLAPLTVHELHPDRQPVGRVDRWCRTGREDQRQHQY